MQHVPMNNRALLVILDDIRRAVDAGDSFEGSIEYLMPGPLADPCPHDTDGDGDCGKPACPHCGRDSRRAQLLAADFAVRASYRVGNLEGQGSVVVIGDPEPAQSAQGCPDGGACHHDCQRVCWRVTHSGPLSNRYPDDQWPPEVKAAHQPPTDEPARVEDLFG